MSGEQGTVSDKKVRLLTFYYAGHRLGFDCHHLSSIQALDEDQIQEGVKTIESHLGILEPDKKSYTHILHFYKQLERGISIAVNGPINLIEFPAHNIYPLPQFIACRSSYQHIKALAEVDEEFFFLLDVVT